MIQFDSFGVAEAHTNKNLVHNNKSILVNTNSIELLGREKERKRLPSQLYLAFETTRKNAKYRVYVNIHPKVDFLSYSLVVVVDPQILAQFSFHACRASETRKKDKREGMEKFSGQPQ